MGSVHDKFPTSLPAQPGLTAEEIDVALAAAVSLDVVKSGESGTFAVSSMDMEQILQAAFQCRGNRYNEELRAEAARLLTIRDAMKGELEHIQQSKRHVYDDVRLVQNVRALLEFLKDHPMLQAARRYQTIQEIIGDNPEWDDFVPGEESDED